MYAAWSACVAGSAHLQQTSLPTFLGMVLLVHTEQACMVNSQPNFSEVTARTCRASMTEEDVAAAIEQRAEARKSKDYDRADVVRAELSKKGIAIMDTPEGVEWRPTTPEQQA